jgi:hypothetical protein
MQSSSAGLDRLEFPAAQQQKGATDDDTRNAYPNRNVDHQCVSFTVSDVAEAAECQRYVAKDDDVRPPAASPHWLAS